MYPALGAAGPVVLVRRRRWSSPGAGNVTEATDAATRSAEARPALVGCPGSARDPRAAHRRRPRRRSGLPGRGWPVQPAGGRARWAGLDRRRWLGRWAGPGRARGSADGYADERDDPADGAAGRSGRRRAAGSQRLPRLAGRAAPGVPRRLAAAAAAVSVAAPSPPPTTAAASAGAARGDPSGW